MRAGGGGGGGGADSNERNSAFHVNIVRVEYRSNALREVIHSRLRVYI